MAFIACLLTYLLLT